MRTSRLTIFARVTFAVFIVFMMMAMAWNSITKTNFWKVGEIAISSVLAVLVFGGLAWLIVHLGMVIFYGRNPEYHAYRRNGGDPYFDNLPRPFNTDSKSVRQTGLAEPNSNFTPPKSWQFQCPRCGARVEHQIDVCWNCNYGADGDSSDYVRRFGVKPQGLSDEQWERVKRGEPVNGQCNGDTCDPFDEDNGYDGWLPVNERP